MRSTGVSLSGEEWYFAADMIGCENLNGKKIKESFFFSLPSFLIETVRAEYSVPLTTDTRGAVGK